MTCEPCASRISANPHAFNSHWQGLRLEFFYDCLSSLSCIIFPRICRGSPAALSIFFWRTAYRTTNNHVRKWQAGWQAEPNQMKTRFSSRDTHSLSVAISCALAFFLSHGEHATTTITAVLGTGLVYIWSTSSLV